MHKGLATAFLITTATFVGACATTHPPVEGMRARGDRHYALGDYQAAAAEYALVADRYPGDWRAQYMLGRSLMEVGRLDDARRALEIAFSRRPTNLAIEDALSETLYRLGNETHLYEFLRRRAEDTGSARSHLRLAMYALQLDDPDAAAQAIKTAIVIDEGQTVEPYLAAADLAQRLGDRQEAKRRLCQAYGIDGNDARVRERLRALGEVPGPTLALAPGW